MEHAPLTERESQVLDLIAAGLSDREIGERLGISSSTASVHVRHARLKLGARNRAHAVALASPAYR